MMKNRITQTALAISAGIIFLTCTNPFFPGINDNTPNSNPPPVNRAPVSNTCIVTFFPGEGANLVDDTIHTVAEVFAPLHLTEGAKIPKLPALKRDGYAFGGWYTDAAFSTLWNFDTPVTGDMSLYAKWGVPIYTVTFYADNGDPKPNNQTLMSGTLVVEPPPMTKTGYAFDGWYKDAAYTNVWDFTGDTITGDTNLYAKWHQIVYTVKFETNGGTPIPADQNIAFGGKAVIPPTPHRDSDDDDIFYSFGGWYKEAACVNEWDFTYTTVTGNITLYAKWDNEDFCIVEFNPNFGDLPVAVEYIANGSRIYEQIPVLFHDDYGFAGWYKEEECIHEWDFSNDTVTSKYTTLWAKWVDSRQTVTFNANGGNPAPAEQYIALGSKAVTPPPMTRNGYGFAGWYKEEACINEWNFTSDIVNNDITLYAKWVVPPTYYTVTFNTNSPDIMAPLPQTIIEGGQITEPLGTAMRQEGYSFRGWFTEDGALWNFAAGTVTGNMTLHAEWSILYYTVVFNMGIINPVSSNQNVIYGGGNLSPESQTIAYGGKAAEPPGMSRDDMTVTDGYGFDGWWLWADSSVPAEWKFEDNTAGPAYTTIGTTNINLYPRWIKDQKYLDYPSTNASDPAYNNPINNGNLVWVRNGSFTMGSQSVSGSRPEHQVTLTKGFFIGMYLITREQYIKVMNDDPNSNKDRQNLPANRVTWLDAIMFCNKLTEMENNAKGTSLIPVYTIDNSSIVLADGSRWPPISSHTIISAKVTINWDANGYRLPTEAEWEYAARGGKGSPGSYEWSGSNTASEVAWYGGTGGTVTDRQTRPVGLLKPNILRTFDMSGNLCEWCWDEFGSGYYATSSPSITDPKGPGPDTVIINNPGLDTPRSRRGGSWNHGINNTRTFIRDSFQPTDTNMTNFWTIGFRVVRGPL